MDRNALRNWLSSARFQPFERHGCSDEAKALLLALLKESKDLFFLLDIQENLIYLFPSFFSSLGYNREQITDLLPVDLLHPEDYAQPMAGGTLSSACFRLKKSDGSWLWLEASGFPGHLADRSCWIAIAHDFSAHQELLDSLRKSEALLRAVVETAVDGIITINERGIILSANPAVERIFGYRPEEIQGRNVSMLMPEPDSSRHDRYLANYLSTGERKIIGIGREVRGKRKSGALFPMELAVSESRLGDRRIFTGLVRDITERKIAERRIQELNETLEHRVKERTRVLQAYQQKLQNMAFELTRLEFRERRRISVDLHDHLAQTLVVGRLRLGRLISQIDAHSLREPLQELDQVMDEALRQTRSVIADLSPNILYDAGLEMGLKWLAGRLKAEGLLVHAQMEGNMIRLQEEQEMQIFQIIREVLMEILECSGKGEAVVTLHFQEQELTLSIEETQYAVEEDPNRSLSDCLSEPEFFQTQERVKFLGGSMEIASAAPKQILIRITIPLLHRMVPEDPLYTISSFDPLPTDSAVVADSEDSVRVLIADDHALLREGLRKVIELCPRFRLVGEAANGEEAVELARSLHPDVVVMDVNMPRMNGIEATRYIKRLLPETTIIGLSVHDEESIIRSMKLAGASDFVTKGAPPEQICHVILSQL